MSPSLPVALKALATVTRFKVGEAVYVCGQGAEFWYQLVTGAARKCAFTANGERQIVDFLAPGDLFGFDARGAHSFSVTAIASGTTVTRYPRSAVERLVDCDPELARQVRELAFDWVGRMQRRMVIVGRATALEKVSTFLLEMTERFCERPGSCVTLPMSRYDIADYVAVAAETVSRALRVLQDRKIIRFASVRRVQICDRAALESVFESTSPVITTRPSYGGDVGPKRSVLIVSAS